MKDVILPIFCQRSCTLVIAGVSPCWHISACCQETSSAQAEFYGDSFVAMLFKQHKSGVSGVCVPHGLCQFEQGTELQVLLAQKDGRNAALPQASLGLQGTPYEQFPGCLQNAEPPFVPRTGEGCW